MIIKRILTIVGVALLIIFLFKNIALRTITKNWEKEKLIFENEDFKIEMAVNLSKGCAKRGIDFYGDTIVIYNKKLNDILLILAQKNINSSEFINTANIPVRGFNFSYYPKDSTGNYKIHKNKILDKLSREYNFEYHFDSIRIQEYVTKLIDKEKLNKKKVSENSGKFRMSKDYIEFIGTDLDKIFSALNYFIKGQVFENNIKDFQSYSFIVPSIEREEILMYFDNNLGIGFDTRTKSIERLVVEF